MGFVLYPLERIQESPRSLCATNLQIINAIFGIFCDATARFLDQMRQNKCFLKILAARHGRMTRTCCLYYPKKLNYLFLAVFAFSRPFCYAKTAFSYSRALPTPCTPDLFMVKYVVKSEYRMIDMWS